MLLGRHLFVGVMQFYILPIRACVDKKKLSRKNKEMPSYKADHQHLFVF